LKEYKPHGYQSLISNFIIENARCAVWSFMGSGKTVATLTAILALWLLGEEFAVLVIAPKRVAQNTWSDETAKWDHLCRVPVETIVGDRIARLRAVNRITNGCIYTINFENVPWLVEHFGDRWPFKVVVWDESDRLAGFRLRQGSAQAKAIGKLAHTKIERFIELTGTPATNGLQKLWGQMWMLDKGQRLGRTFDAFKQRWFTTGYDGFALAALPHAQGEIQGLLRDLCITIDAKDWFDLAAPIVRKVYVDLPVSARLHYKEMEKAMFVKLECDRTSEAFNAAAKTSKCLQLANGAIYVDPDADGDSHPKAKEWRQVHDAKIEALESIISEANGAALIVVYEFKSDLARLQKAFPKGVVLGEDAGLKKFKAGNAQIGFAHPASIGHGVDGLQNVTNIMVFFGHNWNLGTHMQIIERIGPVRQMQAGFDRNVFLYFILARDTLDEAVVERRESKREIQDILLAAMKRRK
jgi:hypothetical protein